MRVTTRSIARRAPYEAVLLDAALQWQILSSAAMTAKGASNLLVALRFPPLTDWQLRELGVVHFATPFESQRELGLAVDRRHESLLTNVVAEIIGRGREVLKCHQDRVETYDTYEMYHYMQEEAERLSRTILFIDTAMKDTFGHDEVPGIRFYLHRYGQGMTRFFADVVDRILCDSDERLDCLETSPNLAWADLLTAQPLQAEGHPARLPCEVPELLVATRHQLRQVLRLLDDDDYTGG